MSKLSFKIDLSPESLQTKGVRFRVIRVKGRLIPKAHYTKEGQNFRKSAAILCSVHRPAKPFEGPLSVTFVYVLSRPVALSRKKDPEGRLWCDKRPDLTNLTKGFEDVLTGARFWLDDGQLAEKREVKVYAAKGERACIEVVIENIDGNAV
jgi:Holliday junction resolvase RusA-like endonuclease